MSVAGLGEGVPGEGVPPAERVVAAEVAAAEEVAAVLAVLCPGSAPGRPPSDPAGDALARWRHRREAALGIKPAGRPPPPR
jgi:hypothetical protein